MAIVKLDDDLVARYAAYAEEVHQPVAQILERQLARFAAYPPAQQVIPLDRAALQQLESLLGGGTLKSPADLVARVRAYASITLGKVVLDLSPAQKTELAYRAQKQGKTPEAITQELIDQVTQEMFWAPTPTR